MFKVLGNDAWGREIVEYEGVKQVFDKEKGRFLKYNPERDIAESRKQEIAKTLVNDYTGIVRMIKTDKDTYKDNTTKKVIRPISSDRILALFEYTDTNGKTKREISCWSINTYKGETKWTRTYSKCPTDLTDNDINTMLDCFVEAGWVMDGE